jgi:hypothetical protein
MSDCGLLCDCLVCCMDLTFLIVQWWHREDEEQLTPAERAYYEGGNVITTDINEVIYEYNAKKEEEPVEEIEDG